MSNSDRTDRQTACRVVSALLCAEVPGEDGQIDVARRENLETAKRVVAALLAAPTAIELLQGLPPVRDYYADINDPDETGHSEPEFEAVVKLSDHIASRAADKGVISRLLEDAATSEARLNHAENIGDSLANIIARQSAQISEIEALLVESADWMRISSTLLELIGTPSLCDRIARTMAAGLLLDQQISALLALKGQMPAAVDPVQGTDQEPN